MAPIIAIEGLDGSGKSTTVQLLASVLKAAVVRNPPASLAQERVVADSLPAEERRAWYLAANRLAMSEALALAEHQPVVLDRSIASTVCFGAAERGDIGTADDIPPDFPRPTDIVLLSLPESVRRGRHAGRGGRATEEEGRLVRDEGFRERVLAGYRNLATMEVDASGTPVEVVAEILRRLRKEGG